MKKNVDPNKNRHRFISQKALNVFINLEDIDIFEKKSQKDNFNILHKSTHYNIVDKKNSSRNNNNLNLDSNKNKSIFLKYKKLNNNNKGKSFYDDEDDKHVGFKEKNSKNDINLYTPIKSNKSIRFKTSSVKKFNDLDSNTKNVKPRKKYLTHSMKNLDSVMKKENKEEVNVGEFNIDYFHGLGKKTLEIGRRNFGKKKLNKSCLTLSSFTYLKSTYSISVAGKDSGKKKVNQDSYISEVNINGISDFNVFGVLDGHGVNGHLASQFAKKYIVNRIKGLEIVRNFSKPKEIYNHLIEDEYKIITNIFIDADNQIKKQKFNCDNSGTTCVITIQLEEHLICANVGDSRAILIFDENNDEQLRSTRVQPLSHDSKPQNPKEKKRIKENGGIVSQDLNEIGMPEGPYRVWAKGEHYPGIAISRSIGDMDAKKVGVIPDPQIIEYNLGPKSKYMLICSDGIWEYISNEQAMSTSNKYYLDNDPVGLCNELTKKSTEFWMRDYEDCDIDDITVVVAFF